ncbi:hypothetical protein [Pseudomonas sp. 25 E 4]|nr:hypothetical protein [Pseudomonas sp. 25 E 4]
MLALVLLARFEQVGGEYFTVELNSRKVAAFIVVKRDAVVVRQAQVLELTAGVIAIAQGAPALMLGGEAVLSIVFVGQRPVAVFDAEEIALAVVGVIHLIAIRQGFSDKAPGSVSLITGDELTAIVAMFGLFLKMAVEVINVGGALAIKADFLLDQPVGMVGKPVGLADLVFDLGQQ